MNRAFLTKDMNLHEPYQHASSPAKAGQAIRPIRINIVRIKRLFTILVAVLFTVCTFSQTSTPQKMTYQAVIRDGGGVLVTTQVTMRISILQSSDVGTAVYIETQAPTPPNVNGLVTIIIGAGTQVSTGAFADINWSEGPYFIKTETDPLGGTDYTAIVGTSQLLSVPYALYAKSVTSYSETDPRVPSGTQAGEMQYWNGSGWVTVASGNEGQQLTFISGVPTWRTPVGPTDVLNSITGKVWMDRNLGASQVATSSTDADAYGDLYQWGRLTDGHQIITSGTTSTTSDTDLPGHADFILSPGGSLDWRSSPNDNLWQGVNGVNNPCPTGYRIPTETELIAERDSWESNNATGAFSSPLKLPAAGYRNNNGIYEVGTHGGYWSSTVSAEYVDQSVYLYFVSSDANSVVYSRAGGKSVRCIKD
jgi:hypothetical protein